MNMKALLVLVAVIATLVFAAEMSVKRMATNNDLVRVDVAIMSKCPVCCILKK